MPKPTPWIAPVFLAVGLAMSMPALCDDVDALNLQSAPTPPAGKEADLRLAIEAGVGRIDERSTAETQDGRRVSIDLRYSTALSDSWRASFSDRLDDTHPAPLGQHTMVNSLREAYVAWQAPGGSTTFDLGRINVRHGPAYGYNPTDYFRTGALRTVTTADPVTLREIRMGTVMLRGAYLWDQGGMSVALAPKLDSGPDARPGAVDLGATNSADRMLLTVNGSMNDRVSGQGLFLIERGASPQLGASLTALASDALVAHAEWSSGRSISLLSQVLGTPAPSARFQRAAAGMTYTFPSALAVTLEAEYNGAGLGRADWDAVLNEGPVGYQRYIALTQPSLELGSRRAWLLYASQKGLGLKQLDLTGFVRTNAVDHSRMVWMELRYHWPRFDAALQWQRSSGDARSEFGVMPYRQVLQLVGVFYL